MGELNMKANGSVHHGWRVAVVMAALCAFAAFGEDRQYAVRNNIVPARRTVKILGRELVLGEDGLPAQIVSHFSGSNARIVEKGMELLAGSVKFTVDGRGPTSVQRKFKFTEVTPAHAATRAITCTSTSFRSMRTTSSSGAGCSR